MERRRHPNIQNIPQLMCTRAPPAFCSMQTTEDERTRQRRLHPHPVFIHHSSHDHPMPLRITILVISFMTSSLTAQVNTEWLRREAGSEGVFGGVSLGVTVEQGNSDVLDVSASGRIDGRFGKIYTFVIGSYRRSLGDGEAFRNNAFVHARAALPIDTAGLFRIEVFAQKQFDDFLSLKDRNLLGGGVRMRLLDLSEDSLALLVNGGIGAMLENELTSIPVDIDTTVVRATSYLTISTRLTPWISLLATTYYQPLMERTGDFRLLVDGHVAFKASTVLSIFIALNYRFDSEPLPLLKRYDVKLSNGITVEF